MMSTSSSSQPRASISARDMGRNADGAGAGLGFGFAENLMGTVATYAA